MRIEPITMPHPQYRRVAHPNLLRVYLRRPSAVWQVAFNGSQTAFGVTLSPAPRLNSSDTKRLGNCLILLTRRRQQQNLCATRQAYARRTALHQLREFLALFLVQYYRSRDSRRLPPVLRYTTQTEAKSNRSVNYEALHRSGCVTANHTPDHEMIAAQTIQLSPHLGSKPAGYGACYRG